jgi:GNAT superfamily N-acetyltransferase
MQILRDYSPKAIRQAMLNNYITFASRISLKLNYPYIEVYPYSEYTRIYIKYPESSRGTIISGDFPELNLVDKVAEITSFFIERKIPFNWKIVSDSYPNNFENVLVNLGFRKYQEFPGMACNLREIDDSRYDELVMQAGIKMKRVKNEDDSCKFFKVLSLCYPEMVPKLNLFYNYYIPWLDFSSNASMLSYLAYKNNIPVATSTICFGGGVVGIFRMGVIKKLRRKGIGTAMTLYPLIKARKRGYEIAVLQSSKIANNLYLSLGFKNYCSFYFYRYTPNQLK